MSDVTREEFNGLGVRVTAVELLSPKVNRNEEDIQKIFASMANLPYKILGMVSIPTILLIIQIYLQSKGQK